MSMLHDKKKLAKKIEEICDCDNSDYCLLKEIILCSHNDPRFLIQLKCIEKYKYEQSESEDQDIGWEEAHMRWVSEGYAKKFADIYQDDLSFKQIWKLLH